MITGLGMNVAELVGKLMAPERAPLAKLDNQSRKIGFQISDLGRVRSDLSSIRTAARELTSFSFMSDTKVENSDATVASVETEGAPGTARYNLEVNQLAMAKSVSYGISTNDTKTAISGLKGQVNINGKAIDLGNSDLTLEQFLEKVNSKSGETGFIGSAIKQGTGQYRVVFIGKETGQTTDGSTNWNLGTALGAASVIEGKNAKYTLNGIALESTDNSVKDAIQGIKLKFNKVGSTAIDIKKDDDAIVKKVENLVNAYNSLSSNIDGLRRYPSKDSKGDTGGSFKGDNQLHSFRTTLRGIMFDAYGTAGTTVAGTPTHLGNVLGSIGVELQKDGRLSLNKATLKKALSEDPEGVAKMLKDGPGKKLIDEIDNMTSAGGILSQRIDSLEANRKTLTDKKDRMDSSLERRHASLIAQFSRLDATLARMQTSLNNVRSMFG